MDSEKETSEESNKQEVEKGSTVIEEKEEIMDDAEKPGEVKEGGIEKKQENGKSEVIKEEEGNAGEKEEAKEEEEEKGEQEKEEGKSEDEDDEKEQEDEMAEKKNATQRSKEEKTSEKVELSSPRTPGSDRPTRERKTVERFTVNVTAKGSATKSLAIEKGQGTQLKDIPNVAFKLSKRKADENLHLLHSILFGKKAKVHTLKKNIGLFSGFVWVEDEGKQRAKVKEKLDKCVKEKLLVFCDVLNIPVNKTSIKKEELSSKLLEFLKSPYATTDILLADKEKGKKRKSNDPMSRNAGSSNAAGGKHMKKQKLDSESGKKRKESTEEADPNKSEPSESENDQDVVKEVPAAESEERENDSKEETEEDQPKSEEVAKTNSSKRSTKKDHSRTSQKSKSADAKSPVKSLIAPGKSTKTSSGFASKKGAGDSESKSKKTALSNKKHKNEKESEMDKNATAKVIASSKSSTKFTKKDQGKGSKKAKKEPSKEEMHAVVVGILKEVDFNTATLSDILKQLGEHFGTDLAHRKSEVKDIITEIIKNMSDDEDEDEEAPDSGDESGKDGRDDDA